MAVIGDVAAGVSMHFEHVEVIPADIDLITSRDAPRGIRNTRFNRRNDRRLGPAFQQRSYAADMVVVMMGEEDGGQRFDIAKSFKNGGCITRIDQQRPMPAR